MNRTMAATRHVHLGLWCLLLLGSLFVSAPIHGQWLSPPERPFTSTVDRKIVVDLVLPLAQTDEQRQLLEELFDKHKRECIALHGRGMEYSDKAAAVYSEIEMAFPPVAGESLTERFRRENAIGRLIHEHMLERLKRLAAFANEQSALDRSFETAIAQALPEESRPIWQEWLLERRREQFMQLSLPVPGAKVDLFAILAKVELTPEQAEQAELLRAPYIENRDRLIAASLQKAVTHAREKWRQEENILQRKTLQASVPDPQTVLDQTHEIALREHARLREMYDPQWSLRVFNQSVADQLRQIMNDEQRVAFNRAFDLAMVPDAYTPEKIVEDYLVQVKKLPTLKPDQIAAIEAEEEAYRDGRNRISQRWAENDIQTFQILRSRPLDMRGFGRSRSGMVKFLRERYAFDQAFNERLFALLSADQQEKAPKPYMPDMP